MAKTKATKKITPGRRRQVPKATRLPRRLLDPPGAAYARLLADPCNAPLSHPVYGGANGGLLMRARSVFSVNAVANTAGYLHWTPGAIGNTNSELISAEYVSTGTSGAAAGMGNAPGKTFLTTNSTSYRPVAACMQLYYLGSENSRQGFVLLDNTMGGFIDIGGTYSTDLLSRGLSQYVRTPGACVEAIWKPTMADETWIDPSVATAPVDKDRRGSLTIAWGGLPPGVSLSVVLTAIYEWEPSAACGLATATESRSTSTNSVREVMDFLLARGTRFIRGVGTELAMGALAGGVQFAQRTARQQITY